MELDLVRKELNKYDEIIKNMITLRMSLVHIVADIKIKNDLPLYQGKREEEIYTKIESFARENGIDIDLLKNIYKLIISNALDIEENILNDANYSIINRKVNNLNLNSIENEYKKLDNIIENEIPQILSNIKKMCSLANVNLNQSSTLYYNNKINK